MAEVCSGSSILFFYPRTGTPGVPLPEGWDAIPGARGCTPESCSFRDHYKELVALGFEVFGISTQTPEDQKEFSDRIGLPFAILSDSNLDLTRALDLPTFSVKEIASPLVRRLTIVAGGGRSRRCSTQCFPRTSTLTK